MYSLELFSHTIGSKKAKCHQNSAGIFRLKIDSSISHTVTDITTIHVLDSLQRHLPDFIQKALSNLPKI